MQFCIDNLALIKVWCFTLWNQVQLFEDYLESHKLGLKALAMRRIPIDRMKMPWRNDGSKVDCAVYVMWQMEVYMGQTVKDWDIDLKKDPRKQLLYVRVKYCRVLTCEINIFRAQSLEEAKAACDKTCVSNFDRFLETISKKQWCCYVSFDVLFIFWIILVGGFVDLLIYYNWYSLLDK